MAEFHRCDRCMAECGGGAFIGKSVKIGNWRGPTGDRSAETDVTVLGRITVEGWGDVPDLCLLCRIEILQALHVAMLAEARRAVGLAPEYREFQNALTNAPTTSLAPDPRD